MPKGRYIYEAICLLWLLSVFSGQKPCTRIILGMLQSFLHFPKGKDINGILNFHQIKRFPIGTRED